MSYYNGRPSSPTGSTAGLYRPHAAVRKSYHGSAYNKNTFELDYDEPKKKTKKKWMIGGAVVTLILIAAAVVVYLFVIRKSDSSSGSTTGNSGAGTNTTKATPTTTKPAGPEPTTGGDGSFIKLADGTQFKYNNTFGGFWIWDPKDPFNDNARPNSWTPPLNQTWKWGEDRMFGVNLGGLFVLEPFISPELFQRYPEAVDEFTLTQLMAADTARGGLRQLEEHYDTFITEQDLAEIAGAGLNWLRIPLGFWAIETLEGESFLERVSWKYFLRLLEWARKYGLRVFLDLHGMPGSQNGLNHSGRIGDLSFMAGNMGLANAQRALYYLRILVQFVSQPEYRNLVPLVGFGNEVAMRDIGVTQMRSFYLKAYDDLRAITGTGAGNGPFLTFADGFLPLDVWNNFLPGADRIVMDYHAYFAFNGIDTSPIDVVGPQGEMGGTWPPRTCTAWGETTNGTRSRFGITITGEFSLATNDCGFWLREVNSTSEHPQCALYENWEAYTPAMKQGIMNYALANFDALRDWFFWTWKIGPTNRGRVEIPAWSYKLGLNNGWIPKDPRTAIGYCANKLGIVDTTWNGRYQPWQLGTQTSSIPAADRAANTWPPASFTRAEVPVSLMPTFTPTGTVITMPPATFTAAPASITAGVDGWANDRDTARGMVPVAGCSYPDYYEATFAAIPVTPCVGAAGAAATGLRKRGDHHHGRAEKVF